MAYFLKKTKRNDRLYLSIYESFYSPETKNTRHKSFRKIPVFRGLHHECLEAILRKS